MYIDRTYLWSNGSGDNYLKLTNLYVLQAAIGVGYDYAAESSQSSNRLLISTPVISKMIAGNSFNISSISVILLCEEGCWLFMFSPSFLEFVTLIISEKLVAYVYIC